jgi:hypothetical protein
MPGLYGYFGHAPLPAEEILAGMGEILKQDPACRSATAIAPFGAIGAAERPNFPGVGEVLTSRDGTRRVLLEGAIVGFLGEDDPPDPVASARRCIVEKLDVELLARARGSFAAVVLDSRQQKIELISDHNGSLPMSYAVLDGLVLFGSQHKAILATGLWKPQLDPRGAAMLLLMGYLFGQTSLLVDVRQIPVATVVHISAAGVEQQRYLLLWYQQDSTLDRDTEVDHLVDCFRDAVHRCFAVSPRVGVPLSGGLDSRFILAMAPDPSRTPAFTFGKRGCRDLACATRVTRRLGSPHRTYITDPAWLRDYLRLGAWLTEGELGGTHYHILPYTEEWSQHVDVVLDGLGAAHLLGGYYTRASWTRQTDPAVVADLAWRTLVHNVPHDLEARLDGPLVPHEVFAQVEADFKDGICHGLGYRSVAKAMAFLQEHRTRRFAGGGPRLLRWRLDVNIPGFDTLTTVAGARLPREWVRRDRFYLEMLHRGAPEACKARWQHTNLPMSLPWSAMWLSLATQRAIEIVAAKFGVRTCFPNRELHDLDLWMRGPLREFIEDMLLSPQALDRGILAPDLQRQIVRDHLDGRRNFTDLLGNMLALESFCRDFLDDFAGAAAHFMAEPQAAVAH